MWLHSILGNGKTVLSAVITHELLRNCQSDPEKSVVYFHLHAEAADQANELMQDLIANFRRMSRKRIKLDIDHAMYSVTNVEVKFGDGQQDDNEFVWAIA